MSGIGKIPTSTSSTTLAKLDLEPSDVANEVAAAAPAVVRRASGEFQAASSFERSQSATSGTNLGTPTQQELGRLNGVVAAITTPAEATAALKELARNGGPKTTEGHLKMIKSLEVLSPGLDARDISEHVRRRYYPDSAVFMNVGATVKDVKPLPPAAQQLFDAVPSGAQDVKGPDGKLFDIAHTYVGANANLNGRPLAGAVFTHVGDAMQGAAASASSAVKPFSPTLAKRLDAAGDMNESDVRGNKLGSRVGSSLLDLAPVTLPQVRRQLMPNKAPLSQMLLGAMATSMQ